MKKIILSSLILLFSFVLVQAGNKNKTKEYSKFPYWIAMMEDEKTNYFEAIKAFESFCALLFSARRKMLRRVLTTQLHELTDAQKQQFWETCATFHVREDTRPDAISPTSILSLYFLVAQLGKVT